MDTEQDQKKCCCCCKEVKSTDNFGNNRTKRDGLQAACNECRKDHRKLKRPEITVYYRNWSRERRAKALAAKTHSFVLEALRGKRHREVRKLVSLLKEATAQAN